MTELSGAARRAAAGLVLLLGLVGAVAPSVGAAEGPVFHENSAPQPLGGPRGARYPTNVSGTYVPVPMRCLSERRVIWYSPGAGADTMWRNVSLPSTGSAGHTDVALTIGGTFQPLVGDFDGDGCDDVIWYGPGADTDVIWYFAPDGSHVSMPLTIGGTYQPIVGDFDAVPATDEVFWYGPGATAESIWQRTTSGSTVVRGVFVSATAPQVSGTFTPMFDAGSPAIVWYASGTAQDFIWKNVQAGSATVTSVPATIDAVAAARTVGGRPLLWSAGAGADRLVTSIKVTVPDQVDIVSVPGSLDPVEVVPNSSARTGFTVLHQPGSGTDWIFYPDEPASATDVSVTGSTSAFSGASCAVAGFSGLVHCWGNDYGASGADTSAPRTIGGIVGATQVAVAPAFACVRRNDGKVLCWGDNTYGQLGRGTASATPSSTPAEVVGITGVVEVGVGNQFACARTAVTVKCWGRNEYGQLGAASTLAYSATPLGVRDPKLSRAFTSASDVSVSSQHACLVSQSSAYCWGRGSNGELGNGATTVTVATPVRVLRCVGLCGGDVYADLAAGTTHTCALVNRVPSCWGSDSGGQLGNGPGVTNTTRPVAVVGLPTTETVTSISAGYERTCAATASYGVWCWGSNTTGALGTGGPASAGIAPTQVVAGYPPTAGSAFPKRRVAVGGSHSCANEPASGAVMCWGQGDVGQLGRLDLGGLPDETDLPIPLRTPFFGYAIAISVNPGGPGGGFS